MTLRETQRELESENESLRRGDNIVHRDLPHHPPAEDPLHQSDLNTSGGSSSSLQRNPSITRLVAHLDVDLSSLPTAMETGTSVGVATATATVPIKFDSSYRAAMEKGL